MADSTLEELTRYRWSSDDAAYQFSFENPARCADYSSSPW